MDFVLDFDCLTRSDKININGNKIHNTLLFSFPQTLECSLFDGLRTDLSNSARWAFSDLVNDIQCTCTIIAKVSTVNMRFLETCDCPLTSTFVAIL